MAGIDLHLHSTASDGVHPPAEVVQRAAAAGLDVIALTDHDTTDGVAEAGRAAGDAGLRVVAGCEFSVGVAWGEMHLLAYFLPADAEELNAFLAAQRTNREWRAAEIVRRLNAAGVPVVLHDVMAAADGGAVGRPHVARALLARGTVHDIQGAFDRFLGRGRPAFVPKRLPAVGDVTALIRRVGGVSSAAHLGHRASRRVLTALVAAGVDAVEVRHPAHDEDTQHRMETLVRELGLLPSGGSDWHGDDAAVATERAPLGAITVPVEWLAALEGLHRRRIAGAEVQS